MIIRHQHHEEMSRRWFGNLGHFFGLVARLPLDRHLPALNFSTGNGDSLEGLRGMVEAGKVTSVIDREFPLGEGAAALPYLQVGSPLGKIVLTVGGA